VRREKRGCEPRGALGKLREAGDEEGNG